MEQNMKQLDMLTRQKRKDYTAPALLGVSFVCEKGFATSFKSTDSQINSFEKNDAAGSLVF